MIKALHINGEFPDLEKKLLKTWREFCFKSPPLEQFEKKTLHEKLLAVNSYWDRCFVGNLLFYEENMERFALYGFGLKWLDTPDEDKQKFSGQNVAVLIMGASLNKNLSEAHHSISLLRETVKTLKANHQIDVVLWNVNRQLKRKPFEKLMSRAGKNYNTYWQAD